MVKKSFQPKKSNVKFFEFGRKVFLPNCANYFSLIMCPFIYAKKITAPKSKIEKMKIEDFFGRKAFLPHCGRFFLLIKLKHHRHFDIPKNNFNPKIEIFYS
jgi:hypothetical protein